MSLLECRGLVKVYPGGKRAVSDVSFHIEPGEIVGLLGPNGAGKTTILHVACGLIAPTDGEVYLRGEDTTGMPMHQRSRNGMGYLSHHDSCIRKLSVAENLLAILEFLPDRRFERNRLLNDLLTKVGLAGKHRQPASTLSGGERRRLGIARCLASKPSILLLDEPFSGIDPATLHAVLDILVDLKREGMSILFTDHRERETLSISDRTYVIMAGRVVVSSDAFTDGG